jgi:hypothetical protein
VVVSVPPLSYSPCYVDHSEQKGAGRRQSLTVQAKAYTWESSGKPIKLVHEFVRDISKPGSFFAPSLKRNELCRFTIQQFEFAIGDAETCTIQFQTLGLHALGDKGEFH